MHEFDVVTAINQEGEGLVIAELDKSWRVGGVVHGGYVFAIAVEVALAATGRPDPLTVTMHFLGKAVGGRVEIRADVVSESRRFSSVRLDFVQNGETFATAIAMCTDLTLGGAHILVDMPQPEYLSPGQCFRAEASGPFAPIGILDKVDLRAEPSLAGFMVGKPLGRAELGGWIRFDGREPDLKALAMFTDSFPPTLINTNTELGWTPTLELTVHFRKRPAPGYVKVRFDSHVLTDGYLEESGVLWDSDGDVVAMSRQLSLLPIRAL
ncbi:MAG: thioesterase family protein [Acidobacteria bacterium]|nr:thioesterase family protein [Acidobacteriota bacterium]